jgi:hypothetical protein
MTDTIISATYLNGIVLSSYQTTIEASAAIYGSPAGLLDAVYGPSGTDWTLVTYGLISASSGAGVAFASGGEVTNKSSGQIDGVTGVALGGAATVANAGLIAGYLGSGGAGIVLGWGAVTNATGGSIIGYHGIDGTAASVAVVNDGPVTGSASRGGYGIDLTVGGSVTNGSASTITGYVAVAIAGGAGTVSNAGTIEGFGRSDYNVETFRTEVFAAITLQHGGLVTNAAVATISGYAGISILGAPGTILDNGLIAGTGGGNYSTGIALANGGLVTIGASGTVSGRASVIYFGAAGPGTVVNYGDIVSAGNPRGQSVGIEPVDGGSITNATSGTIAGSYAFTGIFLANFGVGASATVVNAGEIIGATASTGIVLELPGSVTNTSSGTIVAYQGVIVSNAGDKIVNAGLITGTPDSRYAGVGISGQGTPITNTAQGIVSNDTGVVLSGGSLLNQGRISGLHGSGVAVSGGAVTNASGATISGNGAYGGVFLGSEAALTNLAGGVITGSYAVSAIGQATFTNAGTITGTGGTAVRFGNATQTNPGGYRLVADPGAVFNGSLTAYGTLNTLELTSATTIGTLHSAITGFDTIAVDPGASWQIAGSLFGGTTIAVAAGSTIAFSSDINLAVAFDFTSVPDTDTLVAALNASHQLTLIDNGATLASVQLDPSQDFSNDLIVPISDGVDGTLVTLCFLPGTAIATPSGAKPVERLSVGDVVLTASSACRPIVWIGHGKVRTRRWRRNAATPVIVRRGAFGPNVPNRDLRVTKGHAFLFDGVLIPVEFLVNHRSILWDDHAQDVTLYHVELQTHDVLIANGAPAESYRDDGNRWLFRNANAGWTQPPKPPCAPVLTGGPIVDAVWHRLLKRAGPRPGHVLTRDPDLHVLADGRRIDARRAEPRRSNNRFFRLPPHARSVRVVSRAASPAELGAARDPRVLGVALAAVTVQNGPRYRTIDASDERLRQGFHGYEPGDGLRWTTGDAVLPDDLFDGFGGGTDLVLHLAGSTSYLADERAAG